MRKSFNQGMFVAFLGAAILVAGIVGIAARESSAHDVKCPVCDQWVEQDTREQDNEVPLMYGRRRIEYRCLRCAIQHAESDTYSGDLVIRAPAEEKGKPVLLQREGGEWKTVPETAVFIGKKEIATSHADCWIGYRAFHTRAAFDAYVDKHKDKVGDVEPLTFKQLHEIATAK